MSLRTLPATDADERLVRQLAANALLGFSREQELDRYVADNLSTEVARLKGRLPSDEASLLSQSDLEADVSRVLRSAFTEQAVRVGTTLAELSETMSSRDAELSALLERLRGEWAKPL
jgi:hypothetical protein